MDSYARFWFRRFFSGNIDIEEAPRCERQIFENIDQITKIVRSVPQELKIAQKTIGTTWKRLDTQNSSSRQILMERVSSTNRNKIGRILRGWWLVMKPSQCKPFLILQNLMNLTENYHIPIACQFYGAILWWISQKIMGSCCFVILSAFQVSSNDLTQ